MNWRINSYRTRSFCLAISAMIATVGCMPKRDDSAREQPIRNTAEPVDIRVDDPNLIQYTLRFSGRHNHYIDVEAVFPASGDSVDLSMATWTPGSYLIREYSRHLESISAATPSGEPLQIEKLTKNRWRVAATGVDRVVVRYRVYARTLTVRNNYVTDGIAVLNGAPTFITVADDQVRPADVALEVPEDWKHSVTALDPHPGGAPHRYVAPDYDTLVDSPIVIGNAALHDFEIEGVPHQLANFGGDDMWDDEKSAKDVEAITRVHIELWGAIPYQRYVYQNVIWESGGGLEHKASTLMLTSRWSTRKREDYVRWLGLVSHEFFHTWNVKRLRPKALGPFDYENERYTRALWIAEGITSYYDDLMLYRANLIKQDEYLETLSKQIEAVQTTPGRAVQSLADSSFDSWIKAYRPNENSENTQVSYYRKGAVVAFLLDAEIRRVTQSRNSLDDVMRLAYERYSGDTGFTIEQFRAMVSEVAGQPMDEFFARAVDGTDELDYQPALSLYGIKFPDKDDDEGQAGDKDDKEQPGYLGVDLGGDRIEQVIRGTPAFEAGLNVDDEILAIGEYRVTGSNLSDRLERYRPGDEVSILIARRGKLQRIAVKLGNKPDEQWTLEIDAKASRQAAAQREKWLTGK